MYKRPALALRTGKSSSLCPCSLSSQRSVFSLLVNAVFSRAQGYWQVSADPRDAGSPHLIPWACAPHPSCVCARPCRCGGRQPALGQQRIHPRGNGRRDSTSPAPAPLSYQTSPQNPDSKIKLLHCQAVATGHESFVRRLGEPYLRTGQAALPIPSPQETRNWDSAGRSREVGRRWRRAGPPRCPAGGDFLCWPLALGPKTLI